MTILQPILIAHGQYPGSSGVPKVVAEILRMKTMKSLVVRCQFSKCDSFETSQTANIISDWKANKINYINSIYGYPWI